MISSKSFANNPNAAETLFDLLRERVFLKTELDIVYSDLVNWERSNLLSIVQEKLKGGESYQVVDDQVRTPTFVEDLVTGIISMMNKQAQGVFNICGEEVLTPYQMATRAADFLGLDAGLIVRTNSSNFNQPARRPLMTGLQINKARSVSGITVSS